MTINIRRSKDFVHVYISDWRFDIPNEDYNILVQVADKYSIPIEVLLEIMIREAKAVKIGKRKGLKKDLIKIINNYFSKSHV